MKYKVYFLIFFVGTVKCSKNQSTEFLWDLFPFFRNLNLNKVSLECRKACLEVMDHAKEGDLSSLKILDATAKLPSGILSGNINQYGDFDACMNVIRAQYCLAEIDLELLWSKQPFLGQHKHLAHSYYIFKENFDDPAHRVPGFSMARWGVCTPKECSRKDVEIILRENLNLPVQIRKGMCQKSVSEPEMSTTGYRISKIMFSILGLTIALATVMDFISVKPSIHSRQNFLINTLLCFSLRKNWKEFVKIPGNRDEIVGLDAIRTLSAFALLMAHRCISIFFNPYINRTASIERFSTHWTIMIKNSILYTDNFLLISGLLSATALLSDLKKKSSMDFRQKLITRLFRILPNFVAIILFSTYFLPMINRGPLWPSVVESHSKLCKKFWWRNMLFIHNYFGFENMCLTHTHQLGIDMQLFVVTPIFIYLISKSKKFGLWVMTSLIILSAILRFYVIYNYELNVIVYYGIPISKMFELANRSYILPTHRASIYLIGVYLAFILHFSKSEKPLWSKPYQIFLWCFYGILFFGAWFGPTHMSFIEYVYDAKEAAWIAAISPILWGAGVSFIIYAINKNMAGFFGAIMTWKYWKYGTKIAYSLYLIQFPIFFYSVGQTKHVDEYKMTIQFQVYETLVILFLSLALTLMVEMPFINLRKNLLSRTRIETRIKRKNSLQKSDAIFLEDRTSKSG